MIEEIMHDHWLKFDEEQEFTEEITESQIKVLDRLGKKVAEWQMTVPAILFLEQIKPLNFVASQAFLFFEPYVTLLFKGEAMVEFRRALSKREGIEILIEAIEKHENEYSALRKARKKDRRKTGLLNKIFSRRRTDEKT
ncbi:hypothetical protein JXI42_05050 [bacterium]|nr:hypothetical protein [bacterium]